MKKQILLQFLPVALILWLSGCHANSDQSRLKIILEVPYPSIITRLASETGPELVPVIRETQRRQAESSEHFFDLFGEVYNQLYPDQSLAVHFLSTEMKDKISYRSSNEDVVRILKEEFSGNMELTRTVLTERLVNYGINKRNIETQILDNRIHLILGIKDSKSEHSNMNRLKRILTSQGNFGFWETYDNTEIMENLSHAERIISDYNSEKDIKESLSDLLAPMRDPVTAEPYKGPVVGQAGIGDTGRINSYLKIAKKKGAFPKELKFLWSAAPEYRDGNPLEVYGLYAVKVSSRDGCAVLSGDVIERASQEFDKNSGNAFILMQMNTEGTVKWAAMTRKNIGRAIAIVLDDRVYSAPTVQAEIIGGNSQITGRFSISEAQDLANLLQSARHGYYLAEMQIISISDMD